MLGITAIHRGCVSFAGHSVNGHEIVLPTQDTGPSRTACRDRPARVEKPLPARHARHSCPEDREP